MLDNFKPENINWRHYFGGLSFIMLILQLFTGLFLIFFYEPTLTDLCRGADTESAPMGPHPLVYCCPCSYDKVFSEKGFHEPAEKGLMAYRLSAPVAHITAYSNRSGNPVGMEGLLVHGDDSKLLRGGSGYRTATENVFYGYIHRPEILCPSHTCIPNNYIRAGGLPPACQAEKARYFPLSTETFGSYVAIPGLAVLSCDSHTDTFC